MDVATSRAPVLLHADLTNENVLGTLDELIDSWTCSWLGRLTLV